MINILIKDQILLISASLKINALLSVSQTTTQDLSYTLLLCAMQGFHAFVHVEDLLYVGCVHVPACV